MIKIAIVEDDPNSCRILEKCLQQYQAAEKRSFSVKCFINGLVFLESYTPDYDIIFMDIEMPHLNGMEAAKQLRKIDQSVCLMFVTNVAGYAVSGYEVGAMDYILKPVNYFSFKIKLEKALRFCEKKKKEVIVLPYEDGLVKLAVSDILFIESEKHYLFYHTAGKIYKVRGSLRDIEQKMQAFHFGRSSNSYLVNLSYVSNVGRDSITVEKEVLPLSRSRRGDFMDQLTVFLGGGILP